MKSSGTKQKTLPPKSSSCKLSSPVAVQDEIEIEIAEVLYGMMRMPLATSKQESAGNDLTEAAKPTVEVKARVSSPILNPQTLPQSSITLATNSSSSNVSAIGKILFPLTNQNDLFFSLFLLTLFYHFSLQLLRERSQDMSNTKMITVHASLRSNPKPKLLRKVKFRLVISLRAQDPAKETALYWIRSFHKREKVTLR